MKVIKILSFVIFLVLIMKVNAQQNDPGDTSKVVAGTFNLPAETVPTSQEDLEKARTDYLQKEWTEIFKKNEKLNWIYRLNPIFKFLFGPEFSLSWAFVTAILLWLILVSFTFPSLQGVFSGLFAPLAISIVFSSLICQLISKAFIEFASKYIKNIWYYFGLVLLLIIILVLFDNLGRGLSRKLKKAKEAKRINKIESETSKNAKINQRASEVFSGFRNDEKSLNSF